MCGMHANTLYWLTNRVVICMHTGNCDTLPSVCKYTKQTRFPTVKIDTPCGKRFQIYFLNLNIVKICCWCQSKSEWMKVFFFINTSLCLFSLLHGIVGKKKMLFRTNCNLTCKIIIIINTLFLVFVACRLVNSLYVRIACIVVVEQKTLHSKN